MPDVEPAIWRETADSLRPLDDPFYHDTILASEHSEPVQEARRFNAVGTSHVRPPPPPIASCGDRQIVALWVANSSSPDTRRHYQRQANRFVAFIDRPLSQVGLDDVLAYAATIERAAELRAERRRSRQVAPLVRPVDGAVAVPLRQGLAIPGCRANPDHRVSTRCVPHGGPRAEDPEPRASRVAIRRRVASPRTLRPTLARSHGNHRCRTGHDLRIGRDDTNCAALRRDVEPGAVSQPSGQLIGSRACVPLPPGWPLRSKHGASRRQGRSREGWAVDRDGNSMAPSRPCISCRKTHV